jgi:hypothetical protein
MNWLERFQWKLQEWCNWVRFFLRITCFSQVQIHDSHVEHLFLVPMMVHRGASSWYQSARWYNPSRNRFLAKSSYVFFFYHALWIHRCCLLPYLATNLASRLFVSGELHLYNNSLTGSFACSNYNISVCLVSDPTCGVLWWNDTCNLVLEACECTCQSSF